MVPARNEEVLLSHCLNSILYSCSLLDSDITFDIILIVDATQDKSLLIGKNILKNKGVVIQIDKANVGYARKQGALIALSRYKNDSSECWIANTDADCIVPKYWLANQLKHAYKGIQAITGIVKVDSFQEHNNKVSKTFKERYIINSDYSHPHVHGANMGFRADAYIHVGGWNELETAEDHDLWHRFIQHKIPLISDAKIWVCTSGRKLGRAPHGFADLLSSYDKDSI